MKTEYARCGPILRAVVDAAAQYSWTNFMRPLTVTEVWRSPRHDNDLHALYRAVDIRTRHLTHEQNTELRDWLNAHAQYDPNRPHKKIAIFGDNDPAFKHNDHMHLQVHPLTVLNFS